MRLQPVRAALSRARGGNRETSKKRERNHRNRNAVVGTAAITSDSGREGAPSEHDCLIAVLGFSAVIK